LFFPKHQLFVPKQMDHLPNEILSKILTNISIQELIQLRAVSTRWQLVIEAFCQQKRSLILFRVKEEEEDNSVFNYDCPGLKSLWLNSNHFVQLHLSNRFITDDSLISSFCNLLKRLFPNLDQLALDLPFKLQSTLILL